MLLRISRAASALIQYLTDVQMFTAHEHGHQNLIFDLRHPMQHQSEFLTKHASLFLLFRLLNIIPKA